MATLLKEGDMLSLSGRSSSSGVPQLEPDDSSREDELQLVEQIRTSDHIRATNHLNHLMRLSRLKLVAERPASRDRDQTGSPLRNILRPAFWPDYQDQDQDQHPNHHQHQQTTSARFRRLLASTKDTLAVLLGNYLLFKFAILTLLLYKRDTLLSHLKPSVRLNALTTRECARREDIYFSHEDGALQSFQQLKSLTSWLVDFAGVGLLSLPGGMSTTVAGLVSLAPILMHYSAQYYLSHLQVRADFLSFIFDPIGERLRINKEIEAIVRDLIVSLANSRTIRSGDLKTRLAGDGRRHLSGSSHRSTISYSCSVASQLPDATNRGDRERGRFEKIHSMQLLLRTNCRPHSARPYNVTSQWHRRMVWLTGRLLKYLWALTYYLSTACLLLLVGFDIHETGLLRMQEIKCQRWHPNGTRLMSPGHLHLANFSSPENLVAYKKAAAADETSSVPASAVSFFYLALMTEAASYFSLRRIVFLVEMNLASYLIACFSVLNGVLTLVGTVDKIVWLRQLEQQVDVAAIESARVAAAKLPSPLRPLGSKLSKRLQRQRWQPKQPGLLHRRRSRTIPAVEKDDERLLETLTVAYINYELFRRQDLRFKPLLKLLLARLFILMAVGSATFYWISTNFATSSLVLTVYWYSALMFMTNLSLLVSSYKSKQLEKIMHKVSSIVAHCSSVSSAEAASLLKGSPLQLSYPVELWRRQLHCDSEARRFLSSGLFGAAQISYETVITFNAYTLALLLVLLRVWVL